MGPIDRHNSSPDIDILLARYVTREVDDRDHALVDDWVAASPQHKSTAEQTYTAWEKSRGLAFSGSDDLAAAWAMIGRHIDSSSGKPLRRPINYFWIATAIAACLLAVAFFLWRDKVDKNFGPAGIQIASGDRSRTDTLTDGSVVTLYPHSRLTYDTSFARANRQVSLTGDGYFAVYPDQAHPFRVAVRDLVITVMGTRFSIASRDTSTEVTVYKGLVEIAGGGHQLLLNAHERLIVRLRDGEWTTHKDTLAKGQLKNFQTPVRPYMDQRLSQGPLPALLVGDQVPVLPLDQWLKGGPLNVYDKGKVYLVDLWALWCGPCLTEMGNLSSLQQRYGARGLRVISATSADAWGNSLEKVKAFIAAKGDTLAQSFAWLPDSWDAAHRYRSVIYAPWLRLAYDSSKWALPQIFLVDREGKIAFIGDGFNLDEAFLVSVLDGRYDTAGTRKGYLQKIALESSVDRFTALIEQGQLDTAVDLGKTIVEDPLVTSHTLLLMADLIFNKYGDRHSGPLLRLGMEAALSGVRVTDSRSPGHLSIMAKGYSLTARPELALLTIDIAIGISEGDLKKALEKDRTDYQKLATAQKRTP